MEKKASIADEVRRVRRGRSVVRRLFPHLLLTLAATLPFLSGLTSGDTFYFRDVSRAFFPQRHYAVRGLLRGELRFWNGLVNEGVPLFPPPISYPFDLLQTLLPSDSGFSFILVLHVLLGAYGFYGLARRALQSSQAAAVGGALIYALGGFYLSCLNLYVHLLSAAWAPFIVWSVLWSMNGSPRRTLVAAFSTAIGLSTCGIEIVAQAMIVAAVTAVVRRRFRAGSLIRLGVIVCLAAALAAPVLLPVSARLAGSERAAGFTPEVVLANSIYPLSLLQTLIADWHGPLIDLANRYWGGNFFPVFPYFLSLYLGATVISLAASSALKRDAVVRSLILLSLFGLWIALGNWSGLSPAIEHLPLARMFRSPSKAFFTVHLSLALLAAAALNDLESGKRRVWSALCASSGLLGLGLVSTMLLPRLAPRFVLWFAQGFFPPKYSPPLRMSCLSHIIRDAAFGGVLALSVCALAALVLVKRLAPSRAAVLAVLVAGADLLRAGSGLNPMVPTKRLSASPQMKRLAAAVLEAGGRLFTCDPEMNPAYFRARAQIKRHSLWTFQVFSETLTPNFNMNLDVPTALSRDLTMMVPVDRVLSLDKVGCSPQSFDEIVDDLRLAGVSHVVSLTPVVHRNLAASRMLAPRSISPLRLYVQRLKDSLPTRFVARHVRSARDQAEARVIARSSGFLRANGTVVEGLDFEARDVEGEVVLLEERADEIRLEVRADKRTVACVRDAYAPGWEATVNGKAARLLRADGRHRAVPIDAGDSRIVLTYRPPGLKAGLIVMGAALVLIGAWLMGGIVVVRLMN